MMVRPLYLVPILFAAFFIQSNESLVPAWPAWSTKCANSQSRSWIRPAFSRVHKSSVIVGSSAGDDDKPAIFFADVDNGTSDKTLTPKPPRIEELPVEEGAESLLRDWGEKAIESAENVIKPLTEIKEGVPAERIKGAAIAASALTFVTSKGGVVASGAAGLGAAYVSISKGAPGDFLRTVGGMTWDATEKASKVADRLGVLPKFGQVDRTVVNKYKTRKPATTEAEDDDDLAKVLKEAESVIGEADAAIAKAEADQKEKVKQSIEEELQKITEKNEIQKKDKVEDETLFDDDQFMDAIELAQEGMEGKIVGVDDIISDSSTKADWDAAGVLAKELGQDMDGTSETDSTDEEEDYEFEDVDLEALGRAAREAVEAFEIDVEQAEEAVLDERQQWADSVIEEDEEYKDWSSFKVVELREELKKRGLKTSGKKADLVSLLESSDLEIAERQAERQDERQDEDEEMDDMQDIDLEALGRQAREAVEMFQTTGGDFDEEPTAEMLAELESELAMDGGFLEDPDSDTNSDSNSDTNSVTNSDTNFSEMTVAMLKEECRSRGLKVGGKKAELIERLENVA